MDNQKRTMTAVVKGYVQGVGFRVFVRSTAWQLGIKGYAKNLPDGTLKVVAFGDGPALEKLLQAIWRGPAGAQIASVDTQWQEGEAAGLPSNFEVKH